MKCEGILKPVKPRQASIPQFALGKVVSGSGISKHIKAYKKTSRPKPSCRKGDTLDVGVRPLCLEPWIDEAIVRYVILLGNGGFPAIKGMVVTASNIARASRE